MIIQKIIIKRADETPYLIRYMLALDFINLRICLHHILLTDNECMHDHPWNFISVILKGSYIEHFRKQTQRKLPFRNIKNYYEGSKKFTAPSFLYRNATHIHRLEIPEGKTCWSLVFMFKWKRDWGFCTKKGWVFHSDYESKNSCD